MRLRLHQLLRQRPWKLLEKLQLKLKSLRRASWSLVRGGLTGSLAQKRRQGQRLSLLRCLDTKTPIWTITQPPLKQSDPRALEA